jgi:hypothetical protein
MTRKLLLTGAIVALTLAPSIGTVTTKAAETLMKYLAMIGLVVLVGCAQQHDMTAVCRDAITGPIKINSLCRPQ